MKQSESVRKPAENYDPIFLASGKNIELVIVYNSSIVKSLHNRDQGAADACSVYSFFCSSVAWASVCVALQGKAICILIESSPFCTVFNALIQLVLMQLAPGGIPSIGNTLVGQGWQVSRNSRVDKRCIGNIPSRILFKGCLLA